MVRDRVADKSLFAGVGSKFWCFDDSSSEKIIGWFDIA